QSAVREAAICRRRADHLNPARAARGHQRAPRHHADARLARVGRRRRAGRGGRGGRGEHGVRAFLRSARARRRACGGAARQCGRRGLQRGGQAEAQAGALAAAALRRRGRRGRARARRQRRYRWGRGAARRAEWRTALCGPPEARALARQGQAFAGGSV
ncbi:hypothetical protein T492DRAFT_1094829, partial [Pavlovales sp. CCMP2436]